MEKTFLDLKKDSLEILGFWDEGYKSVLMRQLESGYKHEVIKEWGISDIVINGDKILVKWYKRHRKLTNEEVEEQYGKQ